MLSREDYSDYCKRFRVIWNYLKSKSAPKRDVIFELCRIRGYDPERMYAIFDSQDVAFLESGSYDLSILKDSSFSDLGLLSSKGEFLLECRFILPIFDMLGNVIALVGYFNDEKKYITTPSRLFSKQVLFYGMEQLSMTGINANYFFVEGIFDTLSLRSIGLNAIGTMGIDTSKIKKVNYNLFNRFIAIPDNDKQGRKVLLEDEWQLPKGSSYFKWKDVPKGFNVKDIDDFVKLFDVSEANSYFNGILNNVNDRVIEFSFKD